MYFKVINSKQNYILDTKKLSNRYYLKMIIKPKFVQVLDSFVKKYKKIPNLQQ